MSLNLKGRLKFFNLFSFCSFHFIDDGFTDSFYIILPFIATELSLSFSQIGLLKAVFSGAMSFFQFPLSLLGEKIGELLVLVSGILGLSIGFLLISKVNSFPTILFSLIFAKGIAAGQHGLGSSIISRIYEISGRRTALGIYNFSGDLGKVCIPFLLTIMINLWGWREAIQILSILGIIVGVLLLVFSSRNKFILSPVSSQNYLMKNSRWGINNKKSFLILLFIGIVDISTRTALLTFLPFLLLKRGFLMGQTGFALTLIFTGGAVGKFICGILAEWFGIVSMVIITEILTFIGILSLIWLPTSTIWFVLPLVGIVLNGTSSVLYATVAEIISPEARARGYGLYYAVTLGLGAISPLVYGILVDYIGLSPTIIITALMVLLTIPFSRYLVLPKSD